VNKLAIIGVVAAGLAVPMAVAQGAASKPTGMSQAEYRALMIRSQGLNQRSGVSVSVKGENYYARGLPASDGSTSGPASSTAIEFQWGDAGIGAAGVLGFAALAAGATLGLRRHRGHLRTS
jgi:hypothetical protein